MKRYFSTVRSCLCSFLKYKYHAVLFQAFLTCLNVCTEGIFSPILSPVWINQVLYTSVHLTAIYIPVLACAWCQKSLLCTSQQEPRESGWFNTQSGYRYLFRSPAHPCRYPEQPVGVKCSEK